MKTRLTSAIALDLAGSRDRTVRARVAKQMRNALARLRVRPVRARVAFSDENGPKGGGIECAITVWVPYRPAMRAAYVADTPGLAFDRSFSALARRLERYRERQRDAQRYPKKYYTAMHRGQ